MNNRTQKSHKKADRPQSQPASSATAHPVYKKSILPNGVRILTEEVAHVQSFALGIWVNTGSRDEQAGEHGIAHFIEHLVFRGTERRSSRQIANYVEAVGGYLNAFTTKEHTCFYVRALSQHFEKVCALLSDVVLHPMFRLQDVEKERAIILEEMKSYEDEPEESIFDYLEEVMFGRHPLAHPIVGTPQSVSAISAEQISVFHREKYSGANIIVAVAGNISHDVVLAATSRLMSDVPLLPVHKRRVPKIQTARSVELFRPVQQTHVALGAVAPGASNDEDYFTLAVFNTLFGEGMSSRLNQSIRERHGLAYTVNSSVTDMRDCCVLSVYAAMEPGNLVKTEKLIQRELELLRTKDVTRAELQRAREQVKSQLIMSFESMSGRMHTIAKSELYVEAYDDVEHTLALVDAVDARAISALIHKWFAPERWHRVVIIPEDKKPDTKTVRAR